MKDITLTLLRESENIRDDELREEISRIVLLLELYYGVESGSIKKKEYEDLKRRYI